MALLDKTILNERNKQDLELVKKTLADNNIEWNWKSIHHTLFKRDIDFESLRVYDGKFNNIVILLEAGLPENRRSQDEAFEVLMKFTEQGIHPARLHKFLMEVMQEKHFFTDTLEEELLQNLLEADKTDEITLRNLIYLLISKEADKKILTQAKDSLESQESNLTNQ